VNPVTTLIGKIMAGMMIFFAFYTGAYTAMSIVTEAELGTLARMYTTPTPRSTILGGKFLAVGLTLVAQISVLIAASALAFRIRWGQPAAMLLAGTGLVVSAAGFGILVLSLIKTTKQAGAVLGGVLSVVGMVGGLFTIAVEVPPAFKTVALFTPHGWAMRAWELTMEGSPPGAVVGPLLVMLAMGAVFFALGVVLARRRFA
jgi:ABC-2 type transport system permease protein